MGCVESSVSKPLQISQNKKVVQKKNHYPKSQLKIISSILPSSKNLKETEKEKLRKKVNKVEFWHLQTDQQPTQNIALSKEEFTDQDKDMLNSIISKNTIFHKLTSEERNELVNQFVLYDFAQKRVLLEESLQTRQDPYLFKKNDIGTMFFVIKSGIVEIEVQRNDGNSKKIVCTRGDSFGEVALMYKTVRTASVKCLQKCTFMCLSGKVFHETLKNITERTIQNNKILIERIKLFQYLSVKEKAKLANHVILLKYGKGDIVFREGQDSLAFFVIISGSVDIKVKDKEILELKSGDYFGESCFQDNPKRSGTVKCSETTQLMSISRTAIQKVFGDKIQEFYYLSILKWTLKRNPIFKRIPLKSAQKLLKQSDIIHFLQGHEILKEGQKVKKLYIPVVGSINEFEKGDIINCQYLGDIQKNKKNSIINSFPLIMRKEGYVCVMDINKVMMILYKHSISISSINSKSLQEMKKLIFSKKEIQENHVKSMKLIRENSFNIQMENLTMVKKIGNGQFGSIYKVRHSLDNSFYALKTFNKAYVEENKMRYFLKQQIEVMKIVGKNNFIVEFQRYFQTEEYIMILMELIDGKDFFDIIMQIEWLSSELIQFFFASFVLALQFFHDNEIIYRDIKPENAVIEPNGYLTIIDMGTARKLHASSGFKSFTIIGTPHYMAPEIVAGKGYSFEADIWSLGVLLYELACGQFPFGQNLEEPIQIYNEIIKPNLSITFPKKLTDVPLKGLISRLLIKDPSIRDIQNFSVIKDSEFYYNFDWQKFEAKTLKAPYKPQAKINLFEERGKDSKKFSEEPLLNFIDRLKEKSLKEKPKTVFEKWDQFI